MNKKQSDDPNLEHIISRRKFLGTTALGSAALLSGGLASLVSRDASAAGALHFVERDNPRASGRNGFGAG